MHGASRQRQEEVEALEAEAEAEHQALLEGAVARHPDAQTETPADALDEIRNAAASVPPPQRPSVSAAPKIGRNDPCPCGSGKKFKKCHGTALEEEEEESADDDQPRA